MEEKKDEAEQKPAPVVKKPRAIIESEDIFDFSNIKPVAKVVEAPKKEEPVKKVSKPVVFEKKSNDISKDYDLGNLF